MHYLENHDQVANAPGSSRLLTRCSTANYRALMAVLLLGPQTPLLFQGQEYGLRQPFNFFADLEPELAPKVHAGRREYLMQFTTQSQPEAQALVPDPAADSTWKVSVLDRSSGDRGLAALVRDLLKLRREDPMFRCRGGGMLDGAVLGPQAFCLRWHPGLKGPESPLGHPGLKGPESPLGHPGLKGPESPLGHAADDRLLVVNLGGDLDLGSAAEPLLAPLLGKKWTPIWSSESTLYGGHGTPPVERPGWFLPAHSAVALRP